MTARRGGAARAAVPGAGGRRCGARCAAPVIARGLRSERAARLHLKPLPVGTEVPVQYVKGWPAGIALCPAVAGSVSAHGRGALGPQLSRPLWVTVPGASGLTGMPGPTCGPAAGSWHTRSALSPHVDEFSPLVTLMQSCIPCLVCPCRKRRSQKPAGT